MDPSEKIYSPLTGSICELAEVIPKKKIIDGYKQFSDYDVSVYFEKTENICIHKCPDSGYRFFWPFDIAADEKFYDFFQQFEWYYVKDRWEIAETKKILKAGMKLLDVGCGEGIALHAFSASAYECDGIEINGHARKKALEKGLRVVNERIEDFSKNNAGIYDVVYSFQVLEHIAADVKQFVQACVDCVKPGGFLIFSVPNNDGFAPRNTLLNYPPHHMGLWNNASLSYLAKIFRLEEYKTLYSPLLKEQLADFRIYAANEIGRKAAGIRSLSRFPFLFRFFFSQRTKAYTIMKIFRKI